MKPNLESPTTFDTGVPLLASGLWPARLGFFGQALLVLAGSIGFQATAPAQVQLDQYRIEYDSESKVYRTRMSGFTPAPPRRVLTRLTDYSFLAANHSMITRASIVARQSPGRFTVRIEAEPCFLFFCRTVTRIEEVRVAPNKIETIIRPESDGVEGGRTLWLVGRVNGRTRIEVFNEVRPDASTRRIPKPIIARQLRKSFTQLLRIVGGP